MSEKTETNRSTSQPSGYAKQPLDLLSPSSGRALFWRAGYLNQSDNLRHLPLLFWLLTTLRPQRYVEIGMTDAVAYFAACQAIDQGATGASCLGIWRQPAKGSVAVPDDVRRRNSDFYSEFSQICTDPDSAVARKMRDGSVDLLVLHLGTDGTGAESLQENWAGKLSKKAVVVVQGSDHEGFEATPAATILRDLERRYPAFHFPQAGGLTVLLWGEKRNDRLLGLSRMDPDDTALIHIQQIFDRLGAAHQFEYSSRGDAKKTSDLQAELAKVQEHAADLRAQLDDHLAAEQARALHTANLQARLYDLTAGMIAEQEGSHAIGGDALPLPATDRGHATAALAAAVDAEKAKRCAMEEELRAERNGHAALKQELKVEQAERAALQKTVEVTKAELGVLSQELKSLRLQNDQLGRDATDLAALFKAEQDRSAALARKLEAAQVKASMLEHSSAEAAHFRARFEAISESTIWRMTAPARRTLDMIRKRRG